MATIIQDKRITSGTGDTLKAGPVRVTPGRNGNFDTTLVLRQTGKYEIGVFMKLQFFFEDGDPAVTGWTPSEKKQWSATDSEYFIRTWHRHVRSAWNNGAMGKLTNGATVGITFNFEIQNAGWMWDHYEVGVKKIPAAGFRTSSVGRRVFSNDVNLDSNDMAPKPSGQIAAAHEFGHMLGLPDEYKKTSPNFGDKASLMHAGTMVRPRHYQWFLNWAETNK